MIPFLITRCAACKRLMLKHWPYCAVCGHPFVGVNNVMVKMVKR